MAKVIKNNIQLKERIKDFVLDDEILDKIVVLEGNEFARGAIGISEDYRVVYSYEKLVEALAREYEKEGILDPEIEAMEWLNYNTLRSIPYMNSEGLLAPIIIHSI